MSINISQQQQQQQQQTNIQQTAPPRVNTNPQMQSSVQQPSHQQQSHDTDTTKFDSLSQALSIITSIRDNINQILDNVAKSSNSSTSTNTVNKSPQNSELIIIDQNDENADNDELNDSLDKIQHLFIKETDTKYVQEKAIELNAKVSQLDTIINSLQPIQFNTNEFFNMLLDQFDEKSTLNASKIMYNYRWLKNAFDDKSSAIINNVPYKRYQTQYLERKSPKYRVFRPSSKIDNFEKGLNQYMNSPQPTALNLIKVVVSQITDRATSIDVIMPQYFKFVLNLYDYMVAVIQVKAIDPRTLTANDGFEDTERKIRFRVFEKLEENAMFASIYYKNTLENQFQAFKHLLNWMKQYVNLFSARCARCEKHLVNGSPPLWRDLKTYEVYHDECK